MEVFIKTAFFLSVSLFPGLAFCARYDVLAVYGNDVHYSETGSTHRNAITKGMSLETGQTIKVGAQSAVHLSSQSGHRLNVGTNSEVYLGEERKDMVSEVLELFSGSVRAVVQRGSNKNDLKLKSQIAAIGVRGTDFIASVEGSNLVVLLREGELVLNDGKPLHAMQAATIGRANGSVSPVRSITQAEFESLVQSAGFEFASLPPLPTEAKTPDAPAVKAPAVRPTSKHQLGPRGSN